MFWKLWLAVRSFWKQWLAVRSVPSAPVYLAHGAIMHGCALRQINKQVPLYPIGQTCRSIQVAPYYTTHVKVTRRLCVATPAHPSLLTLSLSCLPSAHPSSALKGRERSPISRYVCWGDLRSNTSFRTVEPTGRPILLRACQNLTVIRVG
jgi:hypothetical protein